MPPHLAREAVTAAALRGDTLALLSARIELPASGAFHYDRRRAAAFSSALAGRRERALSQLGLGGGVRSVRLGIDTAIVELLTRGPAAAVDALRAVLYEGEYSEPDVPLVLAECVRRAPETARLAFATAVSAGTPLERTRGAAAVLSAVRLEPSTFAVPAVVAASLALAIVAFVQLPGLEERAPEASTPPLREQPRTVIAARPPAVAAPSEPRARADEPEAGAELISASTLDGDSTPAPASPGLRARPPAPSTPPAPPAAPPPTTTPPPAAPAPPAVPAAPPAPPTVEASPPASATFAAAPAEPTRGLTAEAPTPTGERSEKEQRKAERKAQRAAAASQAPSASSDEHAEEADGREDDARERVERAEASVEADDDCDDEKDEKAERERDERSERAERHK